MTRILANATVDPLPHGFWQVHVYGGANHVTHEDLADHRRVYTVEASSDNIAAQEGIRRFTEEIEALSEWK